jgi:hypothetical protein
MAEMFLTRLLLWFNDAKSKYYKDRNHDGLFSAFLNTFDY